MNAGDFFEMTFIALVFLLDAAILHWLADGKKYTHPPRLVTAYLLYRQGKLSRYFPL